jgi:hypothetical protein
MEVDLKGSAIRALNWSSKQIIYWRVALAALMKAATCGKT